MSKKLALGIALTVVCVVGGQMVLTGQEAKTPGWAFNGAPLSQPTPDIEQQIRDLSDALQNESAHSKNIESIVDHAELRTVLVKYVNAGHFKEIIKDLEAIIKRSPSTVDAQRASDAIQMLKADLRPIPETVHPNGAYR